ncbi:MAG TPA: carboxypeptidase-like regulatory domain-containing protein, partial [Vicinamibacterales bacterium]|nr:carboxypeptidase-like regulatory domain-containing protein [Vicinamibacterales bacterium]
MIILLLCVVLAQTDAPSAVVSGRVVDAATGRPIAGVVVTPAGTAVPPPPSPIDALVLARVLTNGEGRFVIRGLRTGSLVLTATKGGYADATYGQRRPGGSTQPVPIKDDDRVKDLEIRMWKHAAITGTIVDDAGEPAIGVRVTAYSRSYVAGRRRFTDVAAGVTDDRGLYRISGLTPGDYAVGIESTQISVPTDLMDSFFSGSPLGEPRRTQVANAMNDVGSAIVPSGTPYALPVAGQAVTLHAGTLDPMPLGANGAIVFPTTFYPAAETAAQAMSVALKSGDERGGVDIQEHAVRAVRVAGTLVGGTTSYTSVRLMPAAADDLVDPLATAATVTDAFGAFTFPAVPPGDYVLKVVRLPRADVPPEQGTRVTIMPGSGTATISGNVPTSSEPPGPAPIPSDATLCALVPISVGPHAIDNLVIPLVAGPRVSGRVVFDGTIDKPSDSTVAGMRIFLDPADGSRQPDRTLALQTGHPDENG